MTAPEIEAARVNVYVLIHNDRVHDMGDTYVRGVYATREAATEAIVTRTASGQPAQAWGAHTASCCYVDESEVLAEAVVDRQEDDGPIDPKDSLIPEALFEQMDRMAYAPNPYRTLIRRRPSDG